MKRTVGSLILVGLALGSAEARAQTTPDARTFFDINGGGQVLSPTLDAGSSFLLFGENGAVRTTQDMGAGAMADIRLGHRISRRLAVAFAVSGFTKKSAGQGTVSEPSPIVVASPTVVTVQSDLTRREIGYHPQIVWFVPWSEKFDVSVFVGPSFVHVQQDVITASVSSTQVVAVGTANETGMAFGGNAGIDATRSVSDRWGLGVFARYVFATADLPSATGVKAGGLQLGGGLRFKF
jgi:hypothetical protein